MPNLKVDVLEVEEGPFTGNKPALWMWSLSDVETIGKKMAWAVDTVDGQNFCGEVRRGASEVRNCIRPLNLFLSVLP